MEHRLQALERMKSQYTSSRVLDLEVIAACEDDEESHTGGDDSFATLDSEFDSEYDSEYEEGEVEGANNADNKAGAKVAL